MHTINASLRDKTRDDLASWGRVLADFDEVFDQLPLDEKCPEPWYCSSCGVEMVS